MTSTQIDSNNLDTIIDNWLTERQELIVLYCSLCGVNALSKSPSETQVLEQLNKFCQVLVDYLSAGHFEIFIKIFEETERSNMAAQVLKSYSFIEESTQTLLNFNDIYDSDIHSKNALNELPERLSDIGELLVSRFDNEDIFIYSHQQAS